MTRRDLLQVPAATAELVGFVPPGTLDGISMLPGLAADHGRRTNIANKSPDLVRRAEGLFRTARTGSPLFPVKPARA